MGARADFYVGTGNDAEWLGSVAFDGYEWAEDPECFIMQAKTEDEFRAVVANMLNKRDDATYPNDGWPWPWNDSKLTDFTYFFDNGTVSCDDRDDWPDMSAVKNVQLFGNRSGLIVIKSNSDGGLDII